jgi:DNA-binding FadR family transcriptional regulator
MNAIFHLPAGAGCNAKNFVRWSSHWTRRVAGKFEETMSSLQPVNAQRLYRMIADQIAGKIRKGDFLPGERLPSERDLAETLQVSRTSVREALIALELEGYIEVRVGTGIFVLPEKDRLRLRGALDTLPASQSDIGPFELITVQLMVEPECAALAAAHGSDEQLAAVAAAARLMEGSTIPRVHNRAFHIAVAAATGNAALVATVTSLWDLHDNSVIFHKLEQHLVMKPEVWKLAEDEHDDLVRAILARDAAAARATMRNHFLGSARRLGEDFGGN